MVKRGGGKSFPKQKTKKGGGCVGGRTKKGGYRGREN